MQTEYILETKGLSKAFRGFVAVDKVNLRVREGEIHALIGPNGAGKTTCFNLLTRFLDASGGEILFRGEDISHTKPAEVATKRLVRSFQISAIFPRLSVLDNIRVGLQRKQGHSMSFWKSRRLLDALNDQAMHLLQQVGLESKAEETAVNLAYGHKRALEIAATLSTEPDLMLLDEPTQGMGHEDVERITDLIRKAAVGRTILMVEHNMRVVANLADTITVLQRGAILAEGDYASVSQNSQVIEAYMGSTPKHEANK